MSYLAADSLGKPDFGALARANYKGWLGYERNVTRGDIDRCHQAGLWFSPICEYGAADALAGRGKGADHGTRALNKLRSWGTPQGVLVWGTIDSDVGTGAKWESVAEYFRGLGDVLRSGGYPIGCYGGDDIIDWLLDRNIVQAGWSVAARSWRHGRYSNRVAIRQRVEQPTYGTAIDINDVYTDLGAWMPDGSVQGLKQKEWDEMASKAEIKDAVREVFKEHSPIVVAWKGSHAFECWGFFARHINQDALAGDRYLGVPDLGDPGINWWSRFTIVPEDHFDGASWPQQ